MWCSRGNTRDNKEEGKEFLRINFLPLCDTAPTREENAYSFQQAHTMKSGDTAFITARPPLTNKRVFPVEHSL
jgi:hypothetical protein